MGRLQRLVVVSGALSLMMGLVLSGCGGGAPVTPICENCKCEGNLCKWKGPANATTVLIDLKPGQVYESDALVMMLPGPMICNTQSFTSEQSANFSVGFHATGNATASFMINWTCRSTWADVWAQTGATGEQLVSRGVGNNVEAWGNFLPSTSTCIQYGPYIKLWNVTAPNETATLSMNLTLRLEPAACTNQSTVDTIV